MDNLFTKLYENWSTGRITEYSFNMLSEKYQGEQQELDEKIAQLKTAMSSGQQSVEDAHKWLTFARQYTDLTELDAELLKTLIEKIVVHEAVKDADGTRNQEIEIYYRFIGKID